MGTQFREKLAEWGRQFREKLAEWGYFFVLSSYQEETLSEFPKTAMARI